ncbi:MAG: hypothetical protein JSS14_15680 [Proteobacteria bacterium]|nr:hypothetical protein [Pseudomonadota bacterium]
MAAALVAGCFAAQAQQQAPDATTQSQQSPAPMWGSPQQPCDKATDTARPDAPCIVSGASPTKESEGSPSPATQLRQPSANAKTGGGW